MDAARIDSLLPVDPRVLRAGFWGGQVYLHLLLLNRAHKCEGLIPPAYCAPDYLARYLGLDSAPYLAAGGAEAIRFGLKAAAREALIAIEPDGVRLVDRVHWESESAQRVRRFRDRKRQERAGAQNAPGAAIASGPDAGARMEAIGRPGANQAGPAQDPGPLSTGAAAPDVDGSTDGDGCNVTVTPLPPLASPLFSPPHTPPLISPHQSPPVQEDHPTGPVTLQDLGLGGGDLELPFAPGWIAATAPAAAPAGRPKKPCRELPDAAYTAAEQLRAAIVRRHPTIRVARLTEDQQVQLIERWAAPMDRLNRIDGCGWGEIAATISWVAGHEFWGGVILSGDNLRDKWDKIQAQRMRRAPTATTTTATTGRHEPRAGAHSDGEQAL